NPRNIICPFDACHYDIKVYDQASGKLIYVQPFDTLFAEYRTTEPALKGVYNRSLRFPEPKAPVKFVIENRDKKLALHELFSVNIDPKDLHIVRESITVGGDETFEIVKSGDPHDKVDLAFLAEGYTAEDKEKFKADVKKMSDAIFTYDPYSKNKDRFNIYGVFRASAERGMDEPVQRRYKSTALGASYNTFDTDRYLTIPDDRAVYRMAAQVPFDAVVVLVNTNRYGGGGITMDMCVSSVDNATSGRIFVHEFGHSFAALADEYTGDVAYNDMFPEGIEPLECNITRLLDKDHIKWKQFLTPGIQIPTPPVARGAQLPNPQPVGAYEGAGYLVKGMYRPQMNCIMGTALQPPNDQFCAVCKWGIQRMINYYSVETK
ncbi:MAG TPA: M64 family metallopeptidase, partial [Phycisphaerae bacterium]|nr:M64 family metallopeptidase [Phycisphaerae bacterium]